MTVAVDLPKLYRRAINVWVEDALTSEYLRDVWGDPRVLCLISGSTDSIPPAVHDARRNRLVNVFGIADRDFIVRIRPGRREVRGEMAGGQRPST